MGWKKLDAEKETTFETLIYWERGPRVSQAIVGDEENDVVLPTSSNAFGRRNWAPNWRDQVLWRDAVNFMPITTLVEPRSLKLCKRPKIPTLSFATRCHRRSRAHPT